MKKTQSPGGRRKNRNGSIVTKEQEADSQELTHILKKSRLKQGFCLVFKQMHLTLYTSPEMRMQEAKTQGHCKGRENLYRPLGEKFSKFKCMHS